MPTYEVLDPKTNKTFEIQGDKPPSEQELDQMFAQYYGQQEEEPGAIEKMFTGEGGEAETTKNLPELYESGILSGLDVSGIDVAKKIPALLTSTDPQEQAQIALSISPDLAVTYEKAPNGDVYPVLRNNITGKATPINRAGLSGQDALNFGALSAAFSPSGKVLSGLGALGKVGQVAGQSAAISSAIEANQASSGGEFNPESVVADTIFGGFGQGVGDAIGKIYQVAKGKVAQSSQELIDFAKELNLPLFTTDVVPPETFIGKSAQSAGTKIPITGTGRPRAEQAGVRSDLVDAASKRFGDYSSDEVYQSLAQNAQKTKQAAGRARGQYADQVADVEPDLSNTIKTINQEITRLKKTPGGETRKEVDSATIKTLENYKADLKSEKTFKNLDEMRTNFRTAVKGERNVINNRSQAAINRIYNAMTDDMDSVIKSEIPDSFNKWKKANTIYGQEIQQIKKTRLKNVLEKGEVTPDAVDKLIKSNSVDEFKIFYNKLNQRGKNGVKSGLISNAVEKSGGSPKRFLTELKKMNKKSNIAFKGDDKKFIDGIKNYLEHTKFADDAGIKTPTGQELFQIAAPSAVAADVVSNAGALTMSAGALGLINRAYESKPIRDAMAKLANADPRSIKFQNQIKDLSSLLFSSAQASEQ